MDNKERRPKFYSAPMVRYSKLPFRQLVRLYDVDCCYTPMIYAKNFLESEYCRNSEFSTCEGDSPLIVQFASDDPFIFASAAELVQKCSTGIDLNCGCPKSDVRSKGFGSALLAKPELLADIVRQTRERIADSSFTISLKIRIQYPLEKTVDLCRKAEHAGVSHLTVHGRTPHQRSEPVDYDAIRLVKESINVPVIANGDITNLEQAMEIAEKTKVDGLMAANGLLDNPALFAGYKYTPAECVKDFVRLTAHHTLPEHLFHQHLIYMLRAVMTPYQRRVFNELNSRPAIEDFLRMKTLVLFCLGLALAFDPPLLQRLKKLKDFNLQEETIVQKVAPPAEDDVFGQCLSVPFLHAQVGFNMATGIDPGVTWRQASTLDYKVNQLIFNNGTQGLLAACSARQTFAYTLGAAYPWCVNRYYLLGQGNTDFTNVVYYVHLYKHLEFICSVGFEAYEYNLACIKRVQTSTGYNNCFQTFNANNTANMNNFCANTAALTTCVQNVGNTMCDIPTGWLICERERVGFAYDCPQLQCKVPGQQ